MFSQKKWLLFKYIIPIYLTNPNFSNISNFQFQVKWVTSFFGKCSIYIRKGLCYPWHRKHLRRQVRQERDVMLGGGCFEGYGDEADADSAETHFSRHCPHSSPSPSSSAWPSPRSSSSSFPSSRSSPLTSTQSMFS